MAIAFDAIGAGKAVTATSFSYSHTATAGADVFLGITTDRAAAPSAVQYGGTAMTLVGNDGVTAAGSAYLYHLAAVTGGAQTVTGTLATDCNFAVNTVSYTGVSSIGSAIINEGSSTSVSSGSVTVTTGQLAVCAMGNASFTTPGTLGSLGGGTSRTTQNAGNDANLVIGDSSSSTTFTATASASADWGSVAVVLTGSSGVTVSPATATIAITGGTPVITATASGTYQPTTATVHITGGTPTVTATTNFVAAPTTATIKIIGGTQSPFGNVLAKLAAAQTVNIQVIGDSTAAGYDGDTATDTGGWVNALGIALGTYYNTTVHNYVVNGGYPTATSLHSGSGSNFINLYNGGVDGVGLSYFETEITAGTYLATQYGYATPDLVIIYDGYNDIGFTPGSQLASATWVTDYETFLTSYMYPHYPNVPIVVCTQHNAYGTDQAGFYTDQSAVSSALTGNALPLTPAVQESDSGTYPLTWVLDTQQAFNGYTSAQVMSSNLPHPNLFGYAVIGDWMLSVLAPAVSGTGTINTVSPTTATIHVTGGTPVVTTGSPVVVSPTTATVHITGGTPTVTATASVTVSPTTATVVITGGTPAVVVAAVGTVTPTTATIHITGGTPAVVITTAVTVSPATATVHITGHIPTVTTATVTFITPASRIAQVPANRRVVQPFAYTRVTQVPPDA